MQRRIADRGTENYARYEQDKENADFSTGAYTAYVTEKKRKADTALRRISVAKMMQDASKARKLRIF